MTVDVVALSVDFAVDAVAEHSVGFETDGFVA